MAHILVRQKVGEYAKWKTAFANDAEVRSHSGSQGGYVFRNASDPDEVFILLAWDTIDNLHHFAESDELKARMQRAGIVGQPDIVFLQLDDSYSS